MAYSTVQCGMAYSTARCGMAYSTARCGMASIPDMVRHGLYP